MPLVGEVLLVEQLLIPAQHPFLNTAAWLPIPHSHSDWFPSELEDKPVRVFTKEDGRGGFSG